MMIACVYKLKRRGQSSRWSLLHFSCSRGFLDITTMLLEAGAKALKAVDKVSVHTWGSRTWDYGGRLPNRRRSGETCLFHMSCYDTIGKSSTISRGTQISIPENGGCKYYSNNRKFRFRITTRWKLRGSTMLATRTAHITREM